MALERLAAAWHRFGTGIDFFPLAPSFLYNPLRLGESTWSLRRLGGATLYKYTLGLIWLLFVVVPAIPCVLIVTRFAIDFSEFLVLIAVVILVRLLIPFTAAMLRDMATLKYLIQTLGNLSDVVAFKVSDLFGDRLNSFVLSGASITTTKYTLLFSPALRRFTAHPIAPRESIVFINDMPSAMGLLQKFSAAHELSHIGWANYMQSGSRRWLFWHSVLATAAVLSFVNFNTFSAAENIWLDLGLNLANSLLLFVVYALNNAIFDLGLLHAEIEADYGSLAIFAQLARDGDADALSSLSPVTTDKWLPPEDRSFQDSMWDTFAASQNGAASWFFGSMARWAGTAREVFAQEKDHWANLGIPERQVWERLRWNPNFEFRPELFRIMREDARRGRLKGLGQYMAPFYSYNLLCGWANALILALLCLVLPLIPTPLTANTSYLTSGSALATFTFLAVVTFIIRWRRKRRLYNILHNIPTGDCAIDEHPPPMAA